MGFIDELLIILTTGLFAGILCRKWSLTPLMGYLAVGVLIGPTVLGWVDSEQKEIEHLAELGVFFLLFSIGLELSMEELQKMGRYLVTGGPVQLFATSVPVAALLMWLGWTWPAAVLVGSALAFSSTVLVFKALNELGQTNSEPGRRSIAILLFQDAALVPLLLCVPLLSGQGEVTGPFQWFKLALASVTFITATVGLRVILADYVIPRITKHKSPDLVVLLTLTILGGVSLAAQRIGLPPAIGALAAGLVFGGNRWSEQIDSLILPFREAFSAVFFVSLGLLVNLAAIIHDPVVALGGIAVLIVIKAIASTIALRITGISWDRAFGPALGLSHVGEFAFVLILLAASEGVITAEQRQQVLAIAGGTLLVSPILIRYGFGRTSASDDTAHAIETDLLQRKHSDRRLAVIVGMGPIGRAVASRLETLGHEICAIDLNPLNLQAFAQFGVATVAGDAESPEVLRAAGVHRAEIAIVCVPVDEVAIRATAAIRKANADVQIVVRCRYAHNANLLKKAGADHIFSEEAYAAIELVRIVAG
jgi:monovalent cation:H+ antiporter-2, CPA2 family